jgi:hypothetical protein
VTLFNPQHSNFTTIQKLRNVFSEVFLVQIHRELRKIHSEVHIQGKKNFGKRIPKFKIRGKNGNSGGKRVIGVGRENFLFMCVHKLKIALCPLGCLQGPPELKNTPDFRSRVVWILRSEMHIVPVWNFERISAMIL